MLQQHAREKNISSDSEKYQKRYTFSGKIICGECGGTFKRRSHSTGRHKIAWCCSTHISDVKKCSMKYVPDSDLEVAFVTMMNKLIFGHQTVLRPLLISLRGVNSED